ncbi:hypothetical protein ACH4PU_30265 [Streptomyces sp. NPDC021100]|uniref:hypothetical protein n=1 Tax=Streptomyces sp. NPDC021100 TaxID=3365114 RepID=UPI0037994CDB
MALSLPGAEPTAAGDLGGPSAWERLTAKAGKAEVLRGDAYLREVWAELSMAGGTEGAYRFAEQVGLLWVRPDCFAAGKARAVLAAVRAAGFRAVGTEVVRLDWRGVRSLWAYELARATRERLWLLDAVAGLGPSLLVLYADDRPGEKGVARRLTSLKGSNDPLARSAGSLREVTGSPNRALTMVHTANDGADVVREMGVLCSPAARRRLIPAVMRRLESGRCALTRARRTVEEELPALGVPSAVEPVHTVEPLFEGSLEQRWRAVWGAAATWPLLATRPAAPWWSAS